MNLEQVEKLMYEIELENDKLLAEEEKLAEHNSDYQVWVKFYNELNEKNIQNKIKINQLEEELKTISRKEKLLNGQLTRKDKNRKLEVREEIEKLNKEIEINNKNKKDASETCKEIIEKTQNLESSKKINKIKNVIDEKNKEIDDIYNKSKNTIEEHDKKINDVIEKIKNASINNETDKVISYSIELSKLQEEKTGKYYDSQKIIDFMKNNNLINDTEKENNIEKDNNFTQETQEVLGIEDKQMNKFDDKKEIQKKMQEDVEKVKENKDEIITNEDLEKEIIDTTEKLIEENNLNNSHIIPDNNERIFTDEERINKEHRWMNASNAYNTGNVTFDSDVITNDIEHPEIKAEPETNEFTVEEIEPSKENEKLEALKEQFNISKEFIKNSALKIKNVAKLGLDKSKIIASKIKNSKVVAGAIEAIENDMEKNRGRV